MLPTRLPARLLPAACLLLSMLASAGFVSAQGFDEPRKINGYRGIWFDLGQRSAYGSKYSGGLGTYTAKHRPTAIYAPRVKKTFFVYGGTTEPDQRHLLAMISYYDHQRGVVPQPTVVHDKQDVNDPHDNPSLGMDEDGYLWVFVSGRARHRPGYKYRSKRPLDINAMELVSEEEFTYPQPYWVAGQGFLHLFTKYTHGRELYWNISRDGQVWSQARKLAGMGGHYQISAARGARVITALSMHPGGNVDRRTNVYYAETRDMASTWRTAAGQVLETPLTNPHCPALIRDYAAESRLVYLKDIDLDARGQPVMLYITSDDYRPGPHPRPRRWTVAHFTDGRWQFHEITDAWHNYDMGSLYLERADRWRIIAPTEPGPQRYGTGGEVAVWTSRDQGHSWRKTRQLTQRSEWNHGYVRRPMDAHSEFYAFWADGDPTRMTPSRLYFTNQAADRVWRLPPVMDQPFAAPELLPRRQYGPTQK